MENTRKNRENFDFLLVNRGEQVNNNNLRNRMKLLLIATLSICSNLFAQDISSLKSDDFLKTTSEASCKCVDSISTYNKSKVEVAKEIGSCIDKHTVTYQVSIKILESLDIDLKNIGNSDKKKDVNISINVDENTNDYKKYYYEIERYMMKNCTSLKEKITTNEKQNENSVSKNRTALDCFSKGLEEFKKEDYKDAIKYYEKALNEDSNFAFAWDNLGLCYRKLNNFDKAIESYNKSIELDPYGLMPLQNIAIVYQYKKEYQKSIDAYERLALIDNNNPEVYYGIGLVYFSYLNDAERGLENMCKAYNLYIKQKSPYRADAEKVINMIFADLKKQGKEEKFNEILKANNISPK